MQYRQGYIIWLANELMRQIVDVNKAYAEAVAFAKTQKGIQGYWKWVQRRAKKKPKSTAKKAFNVVSTALSTEFGDKSQ